MRWLPVLELIGARVLNFPALASLKRVDEALDCVDKLLNIDQRDQVIDDHEPVKLKLEIQCLIASSQAEKLAGQPPPHTSSRKSEVFQKHFDLTNHAEGDHKR
ncbi:hypothetical protein MJO28_016964 [Puccinia striiformis f. sp. tritici]|nr:hypothetical protein MJO28_016964 [Puccinia striiformis f. sp. tritici]